MKMKSQELAISILSLFAGLWAGLSATSGAVTVSTAFFAFIGAMCVIGCLVALLIIMVIESFRAGWQSWRVARHIAAWHDSLDKERPSRMMIFVKFFLRDFWSDYETVNVKNKQFYYEPWAEEKYLKDRAARWAAEDEELARSLGEE